ncbi:MAG TPA: DUF1570 domain-containing protein [Fibrobacteria bacterium]|nr:DUF1570 domain-containing protein [Fibrobacteria bacterium]
MNAPSRIHPAATLLGILIAVATANGGKFQEYDSPHFHMWSTASQSRTRSAMDAAETLHRRWTAWIGVKESQTHRRHKLRLFSTRDEMRGSLLGMRWAEAIYHDSICEQYDDRFAVRPWHWLVHEATHQLAHEDSRLHLPRWANEGLACLFSTARQNKGNLILGSVDAETYPVWWLKKTPPTGDFAKDMRALLVPPSRFLVESDFTDIGPSVNAHYMSWWSFAHFLNKTDSVAWKDWILRDATPAGLAMRFGSGPDLDRKWYAHVLTLADSAKRQ